MRAELEVSDVAAADIDADETEIKAEVDTDVDAEVQPEVTIPFIEEADGLSQTEMDLPHIDKEWVIVKGMLFALLGLTIGSILLCISLCAKQGAGKMCVTISGGILMGFGFMYLIGAFLVATDKIPMN